MTRKDYILIAAALRRKPNGGFSTQEDSGFRFAVSNIADALASDNPRFSREHFLAVVRGEKDLNSRPARS